MHLLMIVPAGSGCDAALPRLRTRNRSLRIRRHYLRAALNKIGVNCSDQLWMALVRPGGPRLIAALRRMRRHEASVDFAPETSVENKHFLPSLFFLHCKKKRVFFEGGGDVKILAKMVKTKVKIKKNCSSPKRSEL
jgi:hypothetical protein